MMYKFIKATDEKVESQHSAIKNLEFQVSQLATLISGQIQGALPSNIEKNPKEHLKAISLRSGHKSTAKEIEVDKAMVDLIAGLPPPTTVKGKRPPLDMGYRHTSDIGIGTVRSLGPCLGPANEQEQVQVQVQAQERRYTTTTHLQRIEDKIDNFVITQQQMREDIASIRTTLLSSIVNLMWNIENTPNVPNVFSPYVYQNICFPLGNTNLQEQQSMDAYQILYFAMEQQFLFEDALLESTPKTNDFNFDMTSETYQYPGLNNPVSFTDSDIDRILNNLK
ncbi:hypothetical protein FXO37_13240 [Capsicum annuum]|nr:hypothetical protein FXO37_13240 [Capsicum annuum]